MVLEGCVVVGVADGTVARVWLSVSAVFGELPSLGFELEVV